MKKEKEIIEEFTRKENLDKLVVLFQLNSLKVICTEMPVKSGQDKGRIDLLLEQRESQYTRSDKILILEFKRSKVRHSAVDQLNFYVNFIKNKWYMPESDLMGVIVAPDFSQYEIDQSKIKGFKCLQFDSNMNFRLRS